MAARTIVTSHPDVACDMCGRRLLRGEQPDTFLSAGQRRLVCELCTSRATHEGWRRETHEQTAMPRTERPQRGRSLLGPLRQLRWPTTRSDPPVGAEWASVEDEWSTPAASGDGAAPAIEETPAALAPATVDRGDDERADADVRRALVVFNTGEHPRRLAGVARALGAPTVRATQLASTNVAVVVAWELCWYRYEIDLAGEAPGVRLAAEGMELGELAGEDRIANAVADERGELSLIA